MKLVIAVVQNEDADAIVEALLERQFRATRLASTGGFLRRGNTTLLIGVEDDEVETVLGIVRERAKTRVRQESPQGTVQGAAATIFVIPLEDCQRL
ncbi:cyclic-di-AMP receptor [Thermomicrobium sp. 4228-Ro]|uniref:cyclic-di-AMP receptor n=1 Tax=Thermomicrobium sp. 4228-Ro TaxID=2993937 RepID=UPI0022498CC2|nr:cyclic-di-AMP receptor [Thermomicrobium sp. 4228-Ro]MCX2726171.1 cyclic-di-AMP receptor [Thermomicrobium sp. 4228-Ro]